MSDDETANTETKTGKPRPAHWFKPGQSGNPAGPKPGYKHKLEHDFVKALYQDFKAGGVEAIRKCREEKPDVYLNVIAKSVPKHVNVSADDSLADLADGLHAVASFLGSFADEAERTNPAGLVPDGSVLPAGARPQTH